MNLFLKWVELIVTQDISYFTKVRAALRNAGIVYKEKQQNTGHSNRRHGEIGALGENTSYSNIYQVFVKKADIEYAKTLIAKESC